MYIYIIYNMYIFLPVCSFCCFLLDLNLTTFFYTQTPGLLSPQPPPWDAFQQVFVGDLLYIALIFCEIVTNKFKCPDLLWQEKSFLPPKLTQNWFFVPSCPFWIPYVLLKISHMQTKDFPIFVIRVAITNFPWYSTPPKMVIFKMESIGTVQNILNSNGQNKFSLIGWIKHVNPNQFLYGVTWMKVKRDVIVYYQSLNGAFHHSPNISKLQDDSLVSKKATA